MAPGLRDALAALPANATVRFLADGEGEVCESIAIAPISHDTGRTYFNLEGKAVVVCRDDKPEAALAALAGDTSLLVITGGDWSYVNLAGHDVHASTDARTWEEVGEAASRFAALGCEALVRDFQQRPNGLLGIRVEGGRRFVVRVGDGGAHGRTVVRPSLRGVQS